MTSQTVVDAPAKVNLRLKVLAREESGFHGLETIFCAVDLADTVLARVEGAGIRLETSAADLGPRADNLVVRAARRFYDELGETPQVTLALEKRIPVAAGLGGGSSDAAATLRALNALHGDPFGLADLRRFGAELGSDVPFFLGESPFALAWSRGERLLALPPLPARHVLIAHPGVSMPTAEAFRAIAAGRGAYGPRPASIPLDSLRSWAAVASLAANDFQEVAERTVPAVAGALTLLRAEGAELALLSGSGAAVFGVFADEDTLARTDSLLRSAGLATWHARTLSEWPAPRLT